MEHTCSCMAKGRLLVYVESEVVDCVLLSITDENGFRDKYLLHLSNGHKEIRIDNVAMGFLRIETDIDSDAIYYPGKLILFQNDDYIHKLNIIDRRKKSEKL